MKRATGFVKLLATYSGGQKGCPPPSTVPAPAKESPLLCWDDRFSGLVLIHALRTTFLTTTVRLTLCYAAALQCY